jgi:hypothetical protein
MGLLSRHVSELKSEEFVLGVSSGYRSTEENEKSPLFGLESTKLQIVSSSANKKWIGFVAIDQSIGDASVGEAMQGKQFPARCLVTYRRVSSTEKKVFEGKTIEKDIEKLVVTGIEYISQVDLVDVKLPKAAG